MKMSAETPETHHGVQAGVGTGKFSCHLVPTSQMDLVFHRHIIPDLPDDFYTSLLHQLVDEKLFLPAQPEAFAVDDPQTHKGTWTNINLHLTYDNLGSVGAYEGLVCSLFQNLAEEIYYQDQLKRYPSFRQTCSGARSFRSEPNLPLLGADRRKPDLVLRPPNAPPSSFDFREVISLCQIKYSAKLTQQALMEVVSYAWYMFDQQDSRRHVLGATLCSSMLTVCLVDHGGAVSTVAVDIEEDPLSFLAYLSVMLLGSDSVLGHGDNPHAHLLSLHNGRYILQVLARVFSQRALTGICTRVFIAKPSISQPLSWTLDSRLLQLLSTIVNCQRSLEPLSGSPTDLPFPSFPRGQLPKQVAVKDCWMAYGQIPEGFFLDQLAGVERIQDPDFAFNLGFPSKLTDEFVLLRNVITKQVTFDTTTLYHPLPGPELMIPFQHRIHYRLAMKDIIVPITWFSTRVEFFKVLLQAVRAHEFAVNTRKILHGDVSPWNVWIHINKWSEFSAVPDWPETGPPPPRKGILGDWGLATTLPGFRQLVGYSLPICTERTKRRTPHRTGTLPFMATHLLWDEHGKKVTHAPLHDLESFFWIIIWSIVNLAGPFNTLRDWDAELETGPCIVLPPPEWLKWSGKITSWREVVVSRLDKGKTITRHFHAFWKHDAILNGVQQLLNTFLPDDLLRGQVVGDEPGTAASEDLEPPAPSCDHTTFIKILEDIISDLEKGSDTIPEPDITRARDRFANSFRPTNVRHVPPGEGPRYLEWNYGSGQVLVRSDAHAKWSVGEGKGNNNAEASSPRRAPSTGTSSTPQTLPIQSVRTASTSASTSQALGFVPPAPSPVTPSRPSKESSAGKKRSAGAQPHSRSTKKPRV